MSDIFNVNEKMPPNLKEILDDHAAKIYAGLNCVNIGRIEKVNTSEQTVEVTLQIKRLAQDGTSTAWPLLVDCPYFVLQGGGAYIDMPIEPGDYCLVLFNDRNIDTWWDTANMTDPRTPRKHSMSDGIALVGLNPRPQALEHVSTSIGIVGRDKKVRVKNDAETLITLVSDLIDAVSDLTTYGSPTSHAVTAVSKASLENIKTRFASLLEE